MAHQGTRSLRHELAFWQSYFRPCGAFASIGGIIICLGPLGPRVWTAEWSGTFNGSLFSYLTDLTGFCGFWQRVFRHC